MLLLVVKKLFSSLRTNGIYMVLAAQALDKAGINVSVEQLGADLDTIGTGIGGFMAILGILRDYIRKFKKGNV